MLEGTTTVRSVEAKALEMFHVAQKRWEELRVSNWRRKGCRSDCSLFSSTRPEIQSKETTCSVIPQEEGFYPLGRRNNSPL